MTQADHMTRSQWQLFIENQLPDEERERYEDHLYQCDVCLKTYMVCLEERENPAVEGEPESTQRVKATARPFYQKTLFHYGLAACITLVLMATGVFAQLVNQSTHWDTIAGQKQKRSVTDQLMQKTTALLDQLHPITRGGKTGE